MNDTLPLLGVSRTTLKVLAALVWYVGGLALLLKGGSLLLEAGALRPAEAGPWLAAGGGLLLGGLKAKFLFTRSCRKNMARIDALPRPRIWQFYRPGFMAALAVMIATGATLSRLAHGNYPLLISVATLDLAIAVALLSSGHVFWTHKAMVN